MLAFANDFKQSLGVGNGLQRWSASVPTEALCGKVCSFLLDILSIWSYCKQVSCKTIIDEDIGIKVPSMTPPKNHMLDR